MTKMITILTIGLLGALLLTACAQPTQEPNDFPPPPNTPAPASTAAASAEVSTSVSSGPAVTSQPLAEITPNTPVAGTTPGGQRIVTRDDQGKTINMNTGDSFLLQLGDGYNWDINISDPAVLSRVKNIAVIKGAQGVYTANQSGTVTLTAIGDPLCRQSTPPCMMPSISFKITVVVK